MRTCLVFAFLLGIQGYASAETSRGGLSLQSEIQWRLFPKGLSSHNTLRWRQPLYDSDHLLLRGGELEIGSVLPLSPASFHPGVYAKLTPVSPLSFRVQAQQLRYFGLFGNLTAFDGVDADWSEDARPGGVMDGRHDTGYRISAEGTLQLAFGSIIAVATLGRAWIGANVDDGQAWYESTSNMLYAKDDHLDYGTAIAGAFVSGGRASEKFVLLTARWEGYRSGELGDVRHLLGGLVAWKPGWMAERKLVFGLVAAMYAVDPYETGHPYFAGFASFTWDDLLGRD